MQVSVETIGALERRMTVKVPAQRVEQEVETRLKSLSRTASLKGFRPGKVPFKVVQQNFGPQVRDEVLNEILRQTWGEAVVQQKLNPAGGPKLEPLSKPEPVAVCSPGVWNGPPSVAEVAWISTTAGEAIR